MATTIKRGDSFRFEGQVMLNGLVQNITGWSIVAQLHASDPLRTLLQTLGASITAGATAEVEVSGTYSQTAAWPLGGAELDIRLTSPAGDRTSVPTLYLTIEDGVSNG